MRRFAAAIFVTCTVLCGCSSSTERASSDAERSHVVYVVRRGHHTGVAVAVADWPNRNWPVLTSFPQARYLEFGWGDAAYYQAPDPSLGVTIAAVFWPTPTVMEVVPWQAVAETTEDSETVVLHVSDAELQAIAESIDDSFVQPISATGNGYRVAGGPGALLSRARQVPHVQDVQPLDGGTAAVGWMLSPAAVDDDGLASHHRRQALRGGYAATGAAVIAPSRVRICFCSSTKLTIVCRTPSRPTGTTRGRGGTTAASTSR